MDVLKTATEAQAEQTAPEPEIKKQYELPAIIYRAPLEATAGVCTDFPGKAQGTTCTIVNS